ncbi:hypothetical protein [Oceanobacillus manasiensis]|uniref:hypothetical protein n=1 Tax=Oceanobacillus manasiensis TaxID=586413 RepID=UPI0005A78825|nr:hypothetical protein [Oceanobacillus manasiensis]
MKKEILQSILFSIILFIVLSFFDYLQNGELDWARNIGLALFFVVIIRIFLGMDSLFKKMKKKKRTK